MIKLNRTYSSPNLKDSSGRESQCQRYGYDTEEDDFYVIGDRVYVDGYKPASVAYFGEVDYASGDWVGVVLDDPVGQHNGKIHGREYFQCAPQHGLFVRTRRVSRIPDSALGSSAASSSAPTPLPSYEPFSVRASSKSPGNSTPGSYFYDEDYRQERPTTVESLGRKLRSLDERRQQRRHNMTHHDSSSPSEEHRRYGRSESRPSRSHSTESSGRTADTTRRFRASSSTGLSSPVFNFRPQRAPLDDYESHIYDNAPTVKNCRGRISIDLSSVPPNKGDRVLIRTERGEMSGILRYIGETEFATGEWAGVELDRPDGKNDGSVLGRRYFHCPKGYGLFVPAIRVRAHRDSTPSPPPRNRSSGDLFKAMRSTIYSPPPMTDVIKPLSSQYDRGPSASSRYTESPRSSLMSPEDSYKSTGSGFRCEYPSRTLKSNQDLLNHSSSLRNRYNTQTREENFKFDDNDLELQLKKTLQKPKPIKANFEPEPAKPRAVKYTFTSSKYNGSPIAWRTVEYN